MKTSWISGVVFGCLATGCGSVSDVQDRSATVSEHPTTPAAFVVDDDEGEDESEEDVALDQVPAAVKEAALAAVPGLVLKSAEKETENGAMLYCLEGTAGGEAVEVEVRASDLQVLEIERGEDEEDEGDDD